MQTLKQTPTLVPRCHSLSARSQPQHYKRALLILRAFADALLHLRPAVRHHKIKMTKVTETTEVIEEITVEDGADPSYQLDPGIGFRLTHM